MYFVPNFEERYFKLLSELPLGPFERDLIKERYVNIVINAERDYRRTYTLYLILSNIITISGVLITAFVSFDKLTTQCESSVSAYFWIIWTLSILLTLANKWLHTFSIHKKYVLGIVMLEKLYSEGWSFLAGIDKYRRKNYSQRFRYFCTRVEKIKLKSIENMPEMDSSEAVTELLASGQDVPVGPLKSRRSKLKTPVRVNYEAPSD